MLHRTIVCAVLACAAPAGAQELRMLSAFDNRYPATQHVALRWANAVDRATNGAVKMRVSGPEVVNAFEQFEPVSKGAFDVLFSVQPYHIGTTSVSFIIYALDPEPERFRKEGLFAELDKEYARFGLKLLAIAPNNMKGVGGYHAMIRAPAAGGDLKGMKLRGNRLYQPFIESMGASMTLLQVGEVYPAVQKGTLDGAFGPVIGTSDYKWHEVAKFMTRPAFGNVYTFLFANLDRWNKLSPEARKAMAEEAEKVEAAGMKALDEVQKKEEATLAANGVKETPMDPQKFAAALKAFNDGIVKTALDSKATGDRAKAFYEFAKGKGFFK